MNITLPGTLRPEPIQKSTFLKLVLPGIESGTAEPQRSSKRQDCAAFKKKFKLLSKGIAVQYEQ